MKLVGKEKYKYPDGTDRPDDKIIPFLDNPFVSGFHEDRLYYTKDFDVAMYKKIQEGMTYAQAYNALGFDTGILGEDRANAAGKRVMRKARDHKLFTVDETSYDGSVPREEMGELSPEEERAYLKARTHYLEEMLLTQKKNVVRIGGHAYILEEQETREDRFWLVDSFIRKQKQSEGGYSLSSCLRMFGVSRSGYYAWVGRQADRNGKRAAKEAETRNICEKMRQVVIARNGVIPGKRTFRDELNRRHGLQVGVKLIARLMKKMNLVAAKPHKDAYKHQASHNHVCAAPPNAVGQDFFIGPRKVILTDITYLYYGPYRSVFYLCVFRDAFTRENLGWDMGTRMDVSLVGAAYKAMMARHEGELKDTAVYIHSDQGSQYLSTTFKQLLEDDGFIQSVSARGNSQDNSPMESFFSRLKTDIIDIVALCKTLGAAIRLTNGYLKAYNGEHYQYELAGLTPEEFYSYAVTGVYPQESYFGVPASEMMTAEELIRTRRGYADEEARKRREAAAYKREQRRMIDPVKTIHRDQALLDRMIGKWRTAELKATKQVEHLKGILEQTKKALAYVNGLTEEKREELRDPLAWREHEELRYVFAMNELF